VKTRRPSPLGWAQAIPHDPERVTHAAERGLERRAAHAQVHLRGPAALRHETLLRALEREPLVVQERLDAEDEIEIASPIEPLARGVLLGSQQPELGFPVAQ